MTVWPNRVRTGERDKPTNGTTRMSCFALCQSRTGGAGVPNLVRALTWDFRHGDGVTGLWPNPLIVYEVAEHGGRTEAVQRTSRRLSQEVSEWTS